MEITNKVTSMLSELCGIEDIPSEELSHVGAVLVYLECVGIESCKVEDSVVPVAVVYNTTGDTVCSVGVEAEAVAACLSCAGSSGVRGGVELPSATCGSSVLNYNVSTGNSGVLKEDVNITVALAFVINALFA